MESQSADRTSQDTRSAVALDAAEREVGRLQAEVVRLQARVEELEVAAAATSQPAIRRGLASLIPVDSPAARGA